MRDESAVTQYPFPYVVVDIYYSYYVLVVRSSHSSFRRIYGEMQFCVIALPCRGEDRQTRTLRFNCLLAYSTTYN